jgi:hypothetical protein
VTLRERSAPPPGELATVDGVSGLHGDAPDEANPDGIASGDGGALCPGDELRDADGEGEREDAGERYRASCGLKAVCDTPRGDAPGLGMGESIERDIDGEPAVLVLAYDDPRVISPGASRGLLGERCRLRASTACLSDEALGVRGGIGGRSRAVSLDARCAPNGRAKFGGGPLPRLDGMRPCRVPEGSDAEETTTAGTLVLLGTKYESP